MRDFTLVSYKMIRVDYSQLLLRLRVSGAHLGFLEGRVPNLRKGANQCKTKMKL